MPPTKGVTLLKRNNPTQHVSQSTVATCTPAPPVLSERVADAVRTAVDGALTRERARLDATYRARQEALLRVIADVVKLYLKDVVAKAAEREAEAITAFARASADKMGTGKNANKKMAPKKPSDAELKIEAEKRTASAKSAFKEAFEREMLGPIEDSLRTMLATLSKLVDVELDSSFAVPAADSASRIRSASVTVREQASELTVAVKSSEELLATKLTAVKAALQQVSRPAPQAPSEDDIARAEIDNLFADGRIADVISRAITCSTVLQEEAVSGIIESNTSAEELFASLETPLSLSTLVWFITALLTDLCTATSPRLAWVYEAVMAIQDVMDRSDEQSVLSSQQIDALENASQNLKKVQSVEKMTSSDAKLAKLLGRALESTIRSLRR